MVLTIERAVTVGIDSYMHHNGSMITGFAGNDDSPVKMLSYEFAWNAPGIRPGELSQKSLVFCFRLVLAFKKCPVMKIHSKFYGWGSHRSQVHLIIHLARRDPQSITEHQNYLQLLVLTDWNSMDSNSVSKTILWLRYGIDGIEGLFQRRYR